MIVVQCDAKLLQIVLALRSPRRLTGHLHGGEQQRHQHADDRNHHQQFNQGEAAAVKRF
jgi:hypothetical protein